MITTERALRELIDFARQGGIVAMDTEFIWERTYFPQLGLIQLATADEACHLIDPLEIRDFSALGSLLADPATVKILHDAPQDLAILSRITGATPASVFDTRIAAGFAGLSATISLADLVGGLLDIELEKTQTRTNWLARPLDPEQIAYALDDVRYLGATRVLLLSRIIVPEIKAWLAEELDSLNRSYQASTIADRDRFKKIRGTSSLGRRQLAVLRKLASWREEEARRRDRPRGHILSDAVLVDLSRSRIGSVRDLERIHQLTTKKLKQYGDTLVTCIRDALEIPAHQYPSLNRPLRLSPADKTVYEQLSGFIELKSGVQGIDPQLIGSSSELKQLAKNIGTPGAPLPPRLTEGWRKIFLEEFFRKRR